MCFSHEQLSVGWQPICKLQLPDKEVKQSAVNFNPIFSDFTILEQFPNQRWREHHAVVFWLTKIWNGCSSRNDWNSFYNNDKKQKEMVQQVNFLSCVLSYKLNRKAAIVKSSAAWIQSYAILVLLAVFCLDSRQGREIQLLIEPQDCSNTVWQLWTAISSILLQHRRPIWRI